MTGCLEPVFAARPGYRRIYPDLPGMGRTPIGAVTDGDDLLAAVEQVIDERIGAAPFLLLGESYGGYLARAIAHRRPSQVLGLALICSAGTVLNGERTVPPRSVVVADPELIASLDPAERDEYAEMAVVQSAETLRRFREEILSGAALADQEALARLRPRRELSQGPETATPYPGPALILAGRQDAVAGYHDVYPLLDHYPRASFAVLDRRPQPPDRGPGAVRFAAQRVAGPGRGNLHTATRARSVNGCGGLRHFGDTCDLPNDRRYVCQLTEESVVTARALAV